MEKLKITFEDWHSTCGDGCCDNYGTYLYLNGEKLEHPNSEVYDNSYIGMDIENSLEAVLKKLGYEVEFEHKHED
jgi:hypothetical protein